MSSKKKIFVGLGTLAITSALSFGIYRYVKHKSEKEMVMRVLKRQRYYLSKLFAEISNSIK